MTTDILKQSGIYCIRNIVNDKVYVGSSLQVRRRLHQHASHLKRGVHANTILQHSWVKHGMDVFTFDVLEYCAADVMLEREQHFIDTLRTVAPNGYNIRKEASSNTGMRHTDETKLRISRAGKGRKLSPEHCKLIGDVHRGLVHTDETKAKISATKQGKKIKFSNPEERARNISKARTGYAMPDSTKAKLSTINKGKAMSVEAREKISAAHKLAISLPGYVDNRIGRIMPRDGVEKTRAANTGLKRSDDARRKIAEAARKRFPLPFETRAEVLRLIGHGAKRVEVAKMLNMSRYTVGRIALGKYEF